MFQGTTGMHTWRSAHEQALHFALVPNGEAPAAHFPGFSFLEGMRSWQIDQNGGDHWKVENLPGGHGQDFPDPKVKKYFVTSYG